MKLFQESKSLSRTLAAAAPGIPRAFRGSPKPSPWRSASRPGRCDDDRLPSLRWPKFWKTKLLFSTSQKKGH